MEKGFHVVLVNQVCERRGGLERKKRCDSGRVFSPEKKKSFKEKLNRSRCGGAGSEEVCVISSSLDDVGCSAGRTSPGLDKIITPTTSNNGESKSITIFEASRQNGVVADNKRCISAAAASLENMNSE